MPPKTISIFAEKLFAVPNLFKVVEGKSRDGLFDIVGFRSNQEPKKRVEVRNRVDIALTSKHLLIPS